MLKKYAWALILLVFSAANVFASTPNSMVLLGQTSVKLTSPPVVPNASTEILLLREQNKMLKEFQTSLQDTVFWSLTAVLGFVFVLTGLSLFTNFKFYEQDKEKLKREFEDKIGKYRSEFKLQLESYKVDLVKMTDLNNQTLLDRVLLQLSDVRSLVESVRTELVGDIKSKSSEIDKAKDDIVLLKKGLEKSEVALREVESVVWDIRNIPGNVLVTHAQGLRAAANVGSKADVDRIIGKVNRFLTLKFKSTGVSIDRFVVDRLAESLELCDSLCPDGVAGIRELLSEISVDEKTHVA